MSLYLKLPSRTTRELDLRAVVAGRKAAARLYPNIANQIMTGTCDHQRRVHDEIEKQRHDL